MDLATLPTPRTAQRHQALAEANRIRLWRVEFKRDLAALPRLEGLARAGGVILDPPEQLRRMRVEELLLAVHSVGRGQAHRILRSAGVSVLRTLGQLTDRQRLALLAECGRRG